MAFAGATIDYLIYGSAAEPYQILPQHRGLNATRKNVGAELGTGIITELVKEVFRDSPYALKAKIKPVKRINREIQAGAARDWISYGLREWQGQPEWRHAHFSAVDIMPYEMVLVSPRSVVAPQDVFGQLPGQNVIWIHGYSQVGSEDFAKRFGIHFDFAKDHVKAVKMLAQRRDSFLMEEQSRIRYAMASLGVNQQQYNFTSLREFFPSSTVTLMMDANMPVALREFFDQRLQALVKEGVVGEMIAKYHHRKVKSLAESRSTIMALGVNVIDRAVID